MAAEGAEMQVRGGGDALVGGDVAVEAARWVARRILGRSYRKRIAEHAPPARIAEGLLGLQPQAVTRHDPAEAVAQPGPDQHLRREYGQQRLAAAWRDGGEDVAHPCRLSSGDGLDDGEQFALMAAQGGWGQAAVASRGEA